MGYAECLRTARPAVLSSILTSQRFRVVFAFALVYLFWGSTYLGIRIAVERIPPILMAGVRFSVAGVALLAACAAAGRTVRVSRTPRSTSATASVRTSAA